MGKWVWWCPSQPPGPAKAGVEKSLDTETLGREREGRHQGLNIFLRVMGGRTEERSGSFEKAQRCVRAETLPLPMGRYSQVKVMSLE